MQIIPATSAVLRYLKRQADGYLLPPTAGKALPKWRKNEGADKAKVIAP